MKVGQVFCIPHLKKAVYVGQTENEEFVFYGEDGVFHILQDVPSGNILDVDYGLEKRLKKTKKFLKYLFFR
ncbi:hypothetical protein ISTM_252 [Insectomime virus]|uniref:Uncharacterized protein n=1 Tax=Tunisvirus fontaine2 TaxID=1421067 RepID=V9SFW8_9VIRU|nr:hypothetical protein D1R32_gp062 [Tunisvirus fontaine2]AHA46150.1 hypothetical protein ISTM_252 [Insectomime virus]AHC54779.1 hypothetical protein TNS_ORF61 [Tunisvirus fontaine2]